MHATKEVKRGLSDPADALRRIDEVLRLSRSAVWEVDLDGMFTYVSASFEDLLGYRPEELVGRRTIHDFYAPDVPEDLRAELSPDWIANGEEFTELAIPLVAKSGKIVWISSSGTPIRDAEGRITGSRGVDSDITALKRAEENVRASERTLWRQMQEAPLPMAFTDLTDAGELHVNRAFVRVFGYEPEEIPTIDAWFVRSYPEPAYREQVQRDTEEWMAQASRGEVLQPREYRLTCRDGRVLDVEIAAAVVAGRLVGTFTDVTLRRRELELRKVREEELFGILDNLPFPVTVSLIGADGSWRDPENKLVFLNRRHVEAFGYTTEDCPTVGKYISRAYPEASYRDEILAHWDRELPRVAREGGTAAPQESRLRTKSGEVRDVDISATIIGGKMVTCFQDLTERNRSRTELAESEARWRALIVDAPVPISYTPRDTGLIHMNKAFTDVYGWTSEDVPNVEVWFERLYPDPGYRQAVLERWGRDLEQALASGGGMVPAQYRVVTKSGEEREVELSAVVVEGTIFGTFLDLTERNRAERLLRASESSLRALVDNAPVGIVRLHVPSGRLWLNKEFTELLGYTQSDVPTMEEWMRRAYPEEAYRREIQANWRRDLGQARDQGGRLAPSEVRVTDKAGGDHEMQFSAVIVGDEVFGLWVDLTERNRAERLLREQQEQLARVGRVSTLGQLAASLAHELDQPLGAILNNAEAARLTLDREAPDVRELRAIVEDILADDRRAGAVLDRIRGMVRQRRFESQAVPVAPLLQEVVRLVRPLAAPRQIAWQISCEPGTAAIDGDPVLLQQALLNLGLNAVEAIGDRPDGRIEIRAGEAGRGMVEIGFTDNGGGVPSAEFASLFEPFYTTKRDGLGMGLPLVRSIAEEHGGQVRLDNQPGRGLAIYLQLPARRP